MLSFEEFAAAAAKQFEHVTDCRVKKDGNWVRIVVESYLANDDGSAVKHGYAHVEMAPWQYGEGRWATPGPWLLQTFDRAIAEKWQGYTRYATAEEIAAYIKEREGSCMTAAATTPYTTHPGTLMLTFEIPGDPVAKARPRATMMQGRARLYTPDKTEKYEARVALFAQQAMAGRPLIEGAVVLSVTALFPIPASWPKKRQAAARAGTEHHTKKPDLDNVLKAVKDGMNGVAWKDDSQVCVLCECRKGYSDTPRVLVTVEALACAK